MLLACTIALGTVAGVACDDEQHCDVDLDNGDFEERLCETVELISECVQGWYPNGIDEVSDDELEATVDLCYEDLDICAIDPGSETVAIGWSVDEIRGTQNKCIG